MYILSQILVVISDIFLILSMLNKKKKGVVFYLILSTILFACHYLCLGAYTGAVIGFIEIIYLILMYILELTQKTKYSMHLSIGTIIITVIMSILTWSAWYSILPMLAMVIYLTAMMFKNVIIVKSGTFIRLILNATYMLILKSYFGAGLTLVLLVATIIGIIKDKKQQQINLNVN